MIAAVRLDGWKIEVSEEQKNQRVFKKNMGFCGTAYNTGEITSGWSSQINIYGIIICKNDYYLKGEYGNNQKRFCSCPIKIEKDGTAVTIGILNLDSKKYSMFSGRKRSTSQLNMILKPAM